MNPFGNKISAVEFMQLAQSACEQSLNYERLIMGAFFVFRQSSEGLISQQALTGLEIKYGGIIMSNDSKQTKPDCPLIGEDGNIFHIVGIAAKTLKRNGMSAEASEMREKVLGSGSYEEALGIIGEYVNIISVDEPDEDVGFEMR